MTAPSVGGASRDGYGEGLLRLAAGAAEACVAVLEDDELASSAYVQALELLGVLSSGTSTQLWHS